MNEKEAIQLECSKSADSQEDEEKEEVDVKKVLKVMLLKLLQTTHNWQKQKMKLYVSTVKLNGLTR